MFGLTRKPANTDSLLTADAAICGLSAALTEKETERESIITSEEWLSCSKWHRERATELASQIELLRVEIEERCKGREALAKRDEEERQRQANLPNGLCLSYADALALQAIGGQSRESSGALNARKELGKLNILKGRQAEALLSAREKLAQLQAERRGHAGSDAFITGQDAAVKRATDLRIAERDATQEVEDLEAASASIERRIGEAQAVVEKDRRRRDREEVELIIDQADAYRTTVATLQWALDTSKKSEQALRDAAWRRNQSLPQPDRLPDPRVG